MTFKVDKKIPVPKEHTPNRYPFDTMEIGDSFFVTEDQTANLKSVYGAASHHAKRHNKKFLSAIREEGGKRGIRVWRVAVEEVPTKAKKK